MTIRFLICLVITLAGAACATSTQEAEAPSSEAQTASDPPAAEPCEEQAVMPETQAEESEMPAAANPWAEPAREVLLPHCGKCHNGTLPTSLPGARAVYDLSEAIWYARIAPQQYDGMLQRVRSHSAIPEDDKSAIENFVRCARDNDCAGSPN